MTWADIAAKQPEQPPRNIPEEMKAAKVAAKVAKEAALAAKEAALKAAKEEVEWRNSQLHRAIVTNVGYPILYEDPMESETLGVIIDRYRELEKFKETEEFKFLQQKLREAKERYNAL